MAHQVDFEMRKTKLSFDSPSESKQFKKRKTEVSSSAVESYVFVGRKDSLVCESNAGFKSIVEERGLDASFLDMVVRNVSVSSFGGGTTETMTKNNAGDYVKIFFLLTPDVSSRHNCDARPDVVAKLWPSIRSSLFKRDEAATSCTAEVISVFAHTADATEVRSCATSVGCAVARGAKDYHSKASSIATANVAFSFFDSNYKRFSDSTALTGIGFAADGVSFAASLVDMPPNILNVNEFVEIATKKADAASNVTIQTIQGEDLKMQGFGGLYGVGQAAEHPPAMVILRYSNPTQANNADKKTLCWVGKGIVYDTGGLSIKTKTGMPGMKHDMGGAAAIMEAFFAAAKFEAKDDIYAILCLAENAVGPKATRPDDIHILHSGKTVEINNTDAEGRLVLADGVSYASIHIKPDVIANMCTLTGAQGIATGKYFASIMTNDEALETKIVSCGKACGDLCHPMPYCPEIFSNEFASKVADMKNSVANRGNGQVSCAGQFIGNNISKDFAGSWVHIDMAAPAAFDERATGYGVALLLETFVFGK